MHSFKLLIRSFYPFTRDLVILTYLVIIKMFKYCVIT